MRNLILALALSLSMGCASFPQLLVGSGEGLKAVGNEFVAVAQVYKHGCDVSKIIPQSQCQKFREFGEKFKQVYPLAVQLWETARDANDKATQHRADAMIQSLAVGLSNLALDALKIYHIEEK